MASWWLLWEDLLFPEEGTEKKIIQRAEKFQEAGINTVIIFGCHFRWDYIYNWERLHQLLSFIIKTCHKQGIKVFDHHSANLIHRVNSLDDYQNVNIKNRHHVPFFPSREFADTITFNGHKLNNFRMVSVQNNSPCYLDAYNAEIFCMNNTDYVDAYKKYIEKLLETGIDGLMCDDIIYYPGWDGCGCKYCREKFKNQYGHDLPPATDEDFWGNYESPAFKDWINMRYHDSADFLASVREVVGMDFPLMSCCSNSSSKSLDGFGMSVKIMSKSLNNIMLEICDEIVSENLDFHVQIPNFMLHKAIADKHGYPNIGLGYAHNPDSAFVIWAFNKIFGSSAWISTLTGRFGVAEEVRKTIPEEAEIIEKTFNFEKENEYLFCGKSSAELAVMFSQSNLMFNGSSQANYARPWHDITTELFKRNIQFDIVLNIPSPDKYPVLLLSNFDCVSSETSNELLKYMKNGGIVIASGLLGFRDEYGVLKEKSFLSDLGTEFRNGQFDWNVPAADLFDPIKRYVKNSISSYDIYHNDTKIDDDQWISSDSLYWSPKITITDVLDKVKTFLPSNNIEILCPAGWIYRIFFDTDKDRYLIHFLTSNIEAVPYKNFKNTISNQPVIEKLNYESGSGGISIYTSKTQATLHSPDLSESINLKRNEERFNFDLNEIERYFIVEVF
jgi:hypothetical protein